MNVLARPKLHMEYTLIHNNRSGDVPLVNGYDRKLVLSPLFKDRRYFDDAFRWVAGGQYVILDNGAYEGNLTPYSEYLALTQLLKPTVVVAPDLLGVPWEESFDLTNAFVRDCRQIPSLAETKIMVVPQGRTRSEVILAYRHAVRVFDPQRVQIGLGLAYKRWGDTEVDRFQMCKQIGEILSAEEFDFHLLGARRISEVNWGSLPRIKIIGCDTFKPCRLAMKGLRYLPGDPEIKVDRVEDPPVDPRKLALNIMAFSVEYGCRISPSNMKLLFEAAE